MGVNRDHGTGVVEFKGSFLAEIHFFDLFRRGCPDDESRTRYVNNPTPSVSRVRWKLRAEIMKCYGNQGYPLCADTWNRKIDHGEWRALRCINVSYVLFEHRWKWNVVTDRIFRARWFDFFLHVTGYYFINRFYNRFLIYLSIYIERFWMKNWIEFDEYIYKYDIVLYILYFK